MINDKTKKEVSVFGRFLYFLEYKICKNVGIFIGNNERFIEILFTSLFVLLQIWLTYSLMNPFVTCLVIIFLFLLALERVSFHILHDYKTKMAEEKEERINKKINFLRLLHMKERKELLEKINKFNN